MTETGESAEQEYTATATVLYQQMAGLDFGSVLLALKRAGSAEEEVTLLEKLRDFLHPPASTIPSNEDDCEAEWLRQGLEHENPFLSKQPEHLAGDQEELNQFTFYLFERRFGWSEYLTTADVEENIEGLDGRCSSASSLRVQDDTRFKSRLNELLDEYLKWYLAQQLTTKLLESLKYAVTQANNMPVVRNQTFVHVMDWLKLTSEHGFDNSVFPLVKALIVSGITDVWSAIRNTCVARLAQSLDHFSLEQAQEFYSDLIKICQAKDTSWQAKEGAVMGMTTLVRRFSWTGVMSIHNCSIEENSEYILKFGESKQSALPEFILDSVHSVLYSLLAHPQLSIRDQATKAFSSILSRCEFQEAFAAFEEVVNRLCKGTQGQSVDNKGGEWHLPHLAVFTQDFKFLKAYEAEGLLGVCVFLIKHIPPGFLLPSWPLYFSTFNLYLMHPASTVRQATSAVFKYLVAKDSSSPVLLKLVLQGLAADWQVDSELLTCNLDTKTPTTSNITHHFDCTRTLTPELGITREGVSPMPRISPLQERYRAVSSASASTPSPPPDVLSLSSESVGHVNERCPSPMVAEGCDVSNHDHLRASSQLTKYQRISIRCVHKLLVDQSSTAPGLLVSGTWEWREGRLLAYELILKFLISNHIHYLFPTFALPRTQTSATASVDENLIGRCTTSTESNEHDSGRQRAWTDVTVLPSLREFQCITSGDIESFQSSRKSEFSPPAGFSLKSNSFGAMSSQGSILPNATKDPTTVKEAWIKRPNMVDDTARTRRLIRQYSVSCQVLPRRPFRPPKSQCFALTNSLLSQAIAIDDMEKNPTKVSMPQGPVNGVVQCLPSPLGKFGITNGENSFHQEVFQRSTASELEDLPQWATSLELESLSCILYQILLQTIECLADTRWELRRMGQQEKNIDSPWSFPPTLPQTYNLLPLVTETVRWFNMVPLAHLWDKHLTRDNTLMCYGSCIALKHSIGHAGRLMHFLNQPPSTWKDPERCGRAALNMVCEIKQGLQKWTQQVHGILTYSGYDKLTVVAMETIMLAHVCFPPSHDDSKQKCDAEERVLNKILHVFSSSFPDEPLSKYLRSFLNMEKSSFRTSADGFLSCSSRSMTVEKHAQQFGKYFISEVHPVLAKFLKTCEVLSVAVVFPVLVHYIGVFSEETSVCHSLVDGLHYILSTTHELVTTSEQRGELKALMLTYFDFALTGVSEVITTKTLELSITRQILDVFVKVCEFLEHPSLGHLFTAISTRLDYEPDLIRLMSEESISRTGTPDLYILSNDIPTSPVDEPAIPLEDDDEPVDRSLMLPESEALDRSHDSGRGTPHLPTADDDASDMSDWDSWEDEEEDQTALIAVFADFLRNMQSLFETKAHQGVSIFKKELQNCGSVERKVIASVMESHEPVQ